jgi:dissimilatory sulfite reductase (desulfoviridin) alpha/beta subunit
MATLVLVFMGATLDPVRKFAQAPRRNLGRHLRKLARTCLSWGMAHAHVTSRQIVEAQGISHRTLMRMIQKGEIVAAEKLDGITGAYLFEPEEVERAFGERVRQRERGGVA